MSQSRASKHSLTSDHPSGAKDFPISGAYPKFAPWPEALVRESQAAYGQDIDALGRAHEITVLE